MNGDALEVESVEYVAVDSGSSEVSPKIVRMHGDRAPFVGEKGYAQV